MATSLSAGQLFLVEKQVLGTDCEKFRSLRPNAAWGDEAGLPDEHVPTKTGARRIRRNFPLEGGGFCFWKKKTRDVKFSRSRGFHDNFAGAVFSSFLQAGHGTFFLRRRKIQEKLATPLSGVPSRHNNGGKYRSNFFTAPCCFFPPSARFPSRSRSRETPFHSPEFPEERKTRSHTQKKQHATKIHRIYFLSGTQTGIFLSRTRSWCGKKTPFRNRPVDRRRRFFRGHCSE